MRMEVCWEFPEMWGWTLDVHWRNLGWEFEPSKEAKGLNWCLGCTLVTHIVFEAYGHRSGIKCTQWGFSPLRALGQMSGRYPACMVYILVKTSLDFTFPSISSFLWRWSSSSWDWIRRGLCELTHKSSRSYMLLWYSQQKHMQQSMRKYQTGEYLLNVVPWVSLALPRR